MGDRFFGDDDEPEDADDPEDDEEPPRTPLGETYDIVETETETFDDVAVAVETEAEGLVAAEHVRKLIETPMGDRTAPLHIGYGRNGYHGFREAPLPFDALFRHLWVTGTTGYGKSTALLTMLVQHAYAGRGFVYVDPKGRDSRALLRKLPGHRLDDVIWVEPGADDRDRTIGLNLLETPDPPTDVQRENEIENRLETLTAALDTADYWGIDMESITETMGRAMMRSEKPYSVVDMYFTLLNADRREAFADTVEDPFVREYCREIAKMDDETVRPLLKRIKSWIENAVIRRIVAHRESTIDFRDVIDEDRIVIVRTPVESEDVKKLVTLGVLRNVWSAVQQRSYEQEDPDPYFVVCDEFDAIASENLDVESMLARARSMGLSVTLASQYPSQLDADTRKAMQNNCDSLLAFSVNDVDDARPLMKRFGGYSERDLLSTGQFRFWTKLPLEDGEYADPACLHSFPPYPPLRPDAAVDRIIERSLERYGTAPPTDAEITRNLLHHDADAQRNTDGLAEAMAESIRAVQLREGVRDENGWVDVVAVDAEFETRLARRDELSYDPEDLPDIRRDSALIEGRVENDDVVVRLTPDGESVARPETGDVGAAGGDEHDALIADAEAALTICGFSVDVLEQDGSSQPDGVLTHPDTDIAYALEAELKTINRPARVLENLTRALADGRLPLFVVRPGDDGTEYAARLENILSPPLRELADGTIRYYSRGERLTFGGGATVRDGVTAVRPATEANQTVWTREDGERVLSDGDTAFSRVPAGTPLSKDTVPAYYSIDRESGRYTVYERGDTHVYESTDAFDRDWTPVQRPFLPEFDLPIDDYSRDCYVVLIVPPDGSPLRHRDGDLQPLSADDIDRWSVSPGDPTTERTASTAPSDDATADRTDSTPSATDTDDATGADESGVEAFTAIYVKESGTASTPFADLYEAYTAWAADQDVDPTNKRWFARKLGRVVDFETERSRVDGERVQRYVGVALTEDGETLLEPDDNETS